jgi:8-oxo-dGTP diphosphatase
MTDSAKRHAPILAAGGIVLRGKAKPRFAVVRMRRDKSWALPKGKLLPREHARDAAKREVLEETGHNVEGKIKIVQFWLMRAGRSPVRGLTDDVKAVKWLPLKQAIDTLTRPHEKVFLTHVGPIALAATKKSARVKSRTVGRNGVKRRRRGAAVGPVEHVIAMDYEKTRPSAFVKALGNWIGRSPQLSARRAG